MRNIHEFSAVYVLEIVENKLLFSVNADCLLFDIHCADVEFSLVSPLN